MTQALRANYDLALERIQSGIWTVDPALGLIYGSRGQAFRRLNSWGYVQIKFRRSDDWRRECAVLAHRVIWEHAHGPISTDLHINHRNGIKADNRIVNLEVVTPSGNALHAYGTGLRVAHPGTTRLTQAQVLEIYHRCHAGERDTPLALEFGLKRSAINNIRNGWSWAHVTGHTPSTKENEAPPGAG